MVSQEALSSNFSVGPNSYTYTQKKKKKTKKQNPLISVRATQRNPASKTKQTNNNESKTKIANARITTKEMS